MFLLDQAAPDFAFPSRGLFSTRRFSIKLGLQQGFPKRGWGVSLHGSDPKPPTSALGQKQTSDWRALMSALPPKADIAERDQDVRFVLAGGI